MTKAMKYCLMAGLVVFATALTGCVKFKQVTTVMPDGSGKIQLRVGMSEQIIQMAKQQGEDPFKDISPAEMSASSKGIVAFSKPEQQKEGGYTYIIYNAYFEDINKVELGNPDDDKAPMTFAYARDGKSATLTAKNTMILSAVADYKPMQPEEKQFAAGMMAGMAFGEHYALPGAYEDVKGVTAAGSTAMIDMTTEHLLDGTGPIADLKGVEQLVFKITEVKEDKAAMKAFKAELEKAKAEWEAMKKEAEAAE